MGSFRFRRSVRIAPGIKLNVNKKSVSLTGGVRGAHVTRSFGGRSNYSVGVPGTGLWYRGQLGKSSRAAGQNPAGRPSLGRQLAAAPPGTAKAKVGNFFMWLGGLVWLVPLAAVIAAISGDMGNFGSAYGIAVLIWTGLNLRWTYRRGKSRRSAGVGAPAPATPAPVYSPAEQQLRDYWQSLLADGTYTDEDEEALNRKLDELAIDVDELALESGNESRFADLLWQSKLAKVAYGRLPALEKPSLIPRKGEVVHLEGPAALMKRRSQDGFAFYEPDDEGTYSVTSKRFVFVGKKRGLDISYGRMNGVAFADDPEAIGQALLHSELVIHDSQKSSCLLLGTGNADLVAAVIRQAASALSKSS